MIVTIVHVWVKKEFIDRFIEITKENHLCSLKEEGNIRFDVLQDINDPTKFTLYEAYVSEEASTNHKNTTHYQKWRDMVENWMAQPRQGIKHKILYPENF